MSRGCSQIEYAPHNITHATDRHDSGMDQIDQRHVDIDDVAVRHRTHLHLNGNKMEDSGVADHAPIQRAP